MLRQLYCGGKGLGQLGQVLEGWVELWFHLLLTPVSIVYLGRLTL